jgi:glyoxylase-like metal-dependent hydrolase (beta-lactamase superfamily II)
VDPTKGFAVVKIAQSVYFLTEGIYNTMFILAAKGVILFDAPPQVGVAKIKAAIAEVTNKPIIALVYSHGHFDHIGAAKEVIGGAKIPIVGTRTLAAQLKERGDAKRPPPTRTVKSGKSITIAGVAIKLTELKYAHDEGTTLIELPGTGVIMLVDVVFPGWAPFRFAFCTLLFIIAL